MLVLYSPIPFTIIYKAVLLGPLPPIYLALPSGYLIILGFPSQIISAVHSPSL